ncbi:MAG: carboxypeptidase regulatory-like domain-containing protein, partial [Salinibacterium sp.]|nr:carboxypeptidase regulatory-like domain-containing protein [Salinibacterium sp.]
RTEGSADTRAADTMRALLGQLQEGASLTGAGHQRAHAGGRAVVADAEGRFEFRFLPAGRYRLTARVSGYVEGSEDEILLGQDAVRTDVVLTVEPAGTLRLEVGGDPESGSALNLSVFAVEGGDIIGSWLVRAGRSRTVHGLAPGRYRVTATTLTSTVEELIEVRAGEEARLEF